MDHLHDDAPASRTLGHAAPPRTPTPPVARRTVLLAGLSGLTLTLLGCSADAEPSTPTATPTAPAGTPAPDAEAPARTLDGDAVQAAIAALETETGLTLGVAAIDTASGTLVGHRTDERVLLCSTSKVLIVAAVLALRTERPALLGETVPIPAEIVDHSPVTGEHAGHALPVAALCEAALTQSDNTAANALIGVAGGPEGVTAYARTLGDDVTRLDRVEPELNQGAPGDERDTSTPAAIAADLQKLAVEEALAPESRDPLVGWLRGSQTGADRIRAGVPEGWVVGNKTGTGANGEVHDVGVIWPPTGAPLVLAVYTRPTTPGTGSVEAGSAAVARVATIVTEAFASA